MMDRNPRKRRKLKACDACHRRKTKCYWRKPPSCADCIRLGLPCTFDGTLADEAPVDCPAETNPSRRGQTLCIQAQTANEDPLGTRVETNVSDLEAQVARFFTNVNHFFPIFSKEAFKARLLNDATECEDVDLACSAALNAALACINQHQHISNHENSEGALGTAMKYLQKALLGLDKVILQPPTVLGVQALACIVLCLQHIKQDEDSAASILAIAVRKGHSLRLHRLDDLTHLSVEDRMEQLRIFWCLYILDKDISMRRNVPSLMDDDDVFVLEPKLISDDYCGFVQSVEGSSALNLFAARQRLARIGSDIWKHLYTFRSQHQPTSQRREATNYLNGLLADWNAEWFNYGIPKRLPQNWPERSLIPIISLQFQYFLCLLRANPDTPSDAIEVKTFLARFNGSASALLSVDAFFIPPQCASAARDTARLATMVGKGGLAWMCGAIQYTIPAIVLIVIDVARRGNSGSNNEQSRSDLMLAAAWIDILDFLVRGTQDDEFGNTFRACREIHGMVLEEQGIGWDRTVH